MGPALSLGMHWLEDSLPHPEKMAELLFLDWGNYLMAAAWLFLAKMEEQLSPS